jgi:hypothetical protein
MQKKGLLEEPESPTKTMSKTQAMTNTAMPVNLDESKADPGPDF